MSLPLPTAATPVTPELSTLLTTKRSEIKNEIQTSAFTGQQTTEFVRRDKIQKLWGNDHVRQIFPTLEDDAAQRLLANHIVGLSIFVHIGWPEHMDAIPSFINFFLDKTERCDKRLPFNDTQLEGFPETVADRFLEKQYVFAPCVIVEPAVAHIAELSSRQPLPFVSQPKEVGYGGYGSVHKVEIAEGFLQNESNGMSNTCSKIVAFKKVRMETSFTMEVKSLQYLREGLFQGGRNIARHLAAITHGEGNFYIFFPWTDLCDLEILLNTGKQRNIFTGGSDTIRYDFNSKFPYARIVNYVTQLADIASALMFIHEHLPNYTRPPVHCVHMDLRPPNILIFPSDTPDVDSVGRWVLSDFGISAFRPDVTTEFELTSPTVRDLMQKLRGFETNDIGMWPMAGPFRAPELHRDSMDRDQERLFPGRKCDVWSFGCIASEVLAFVLGMLDGGIDVGEQSLKRFRSDREQKANDGITTDYFFQHADTADPTNGRKKAFPSSKVEEWFQKIETDAEKRNDHHTKWILEFINLLRKILVIDYHARPQASAIAARLNKVILPLMDSAVRQPAGDQYEGGLDVSFPLPRERGTPVAQSNAGKSTIRFSIPSPRGITGHLDIPSHQHSLSNSTSGQARRRADSHASYGNLSGTATPRRNMSVVSNQISESPQTLAVEPVAEQQPRQSHSTIRSMPEIGGHVEHPRSSTPSVRSMPTQSELARGTGHTKWPFFSKLPITGPPASLADSSFEAPKSKAFEIEPNGHRIAFIHQVSGEWTVSLYNLTHTSPLVQCKIESDFIKLSKDLNWNRLIMAPGYMVITGEAGNDNDGHLVNLDTLQRMRTHRPWPRPCLLVAVSSRGALAWKNDQAVDIWIPRSSLNDTERRIPLQQRSDFIINCIAFSDTGNSLFVWAADRSHHFMYTINMLHLPTGTPPCKQFPRTHFYKGMSLWPAQSEHACLIQENYTLPYRYMACRGDGLTGPQDIGPSKDASKVRLDLATRPCRRWMIFASLEKNKLRVIRRRFTVNEDGVYSRQGDDEVLSQGTIRSEREKYRITAWDDEQTGVEKVVICVVTGTGICEIWSF